jgi:hypothetical protein
MNITIFWGGFILLPDIYCCFWSCYWDESDFGLPFYTPFFSFKFFLYLYLLSVSFPWSSFCNKFDFTSSWCLYQFHLILSSLMMVYLIVVNPGLSRRDPGISERSGGQPLREELERRT